MMFLPQQSYLPIGTLKAALCYPSEASDFSDEACRDVLVACQLDGLAERLDESGHWENRLSPGEQQRLAMARALLQRPDYLFLDEASSALDVATERHLYDTLLERLPHTAIISVAHRTELEEFHSRKITLERRKGGAKLVSDIDLIPRDGKRRLLGGWLRHRKPPKSKAA